MISSASFSQSPTSYDSDLVTLETPQDYIQLGHQPSDPQNHLNIQGKDWPHGEQEDQATPCRRYTSPFSSALQLRSGMLHRVWAPSHKHTSWAYALYEKPRLESSISLRAVGHVVLTLIAE